MPHTFPLQRILLLSGIFINASTLADTIEEAANKAAAVAFFENVYNEKDYSAAADMLGPRLIQHTPTIADGREGLKQYIDRLKSELPRSSREIKRVLTDRDYVVIQARLVSEPGDRGAVTGDIFRLDGGRIVEHWGIVHAITESPDPDNPNDVFGTASAPYPEVTSVERERRNLALAIP